jgi:hypothetical protein
MTDEDEALEPGPDALAMLYDSFKHVTSLCLFSLAGGVALADKAAGRWAVMLIAALVMIGVAAAISLSGTGMIVDARLEGRKTIPNLRFHRTVPGILLAAGIGVLLYVFARSMRF